MQFGIALFLELYGLLWFRGYTWIRSYAEMNLKLGHPRSMRSLLNWSRPDSVFKVEARAMVEGLFIAWGKGFKRIEVECDNALLIELLLATCGVNSSLVELRLLHQLLPR
ncbi:hypothetical protein Gorai_023526, partial [Gossypium raimondii]|nr:hypothetical protein [Gossypium raimondii]